MEVVVLELIPIVKPLIPQLRPKFPSHISGSCKKINITSKFPSDTVFVTYKILNRLVPMNFK